MQWNKQINGEESPRTKNIHGLFGKWRVVWWNECTVSSVWVWARVRQEVTVITSRDIQVKGLWVSQGRIWTLFCRKSNWMICLFLWCWIVFLSVLLPFFIHELFQINIRWKISVYFVGDVWDLLGRTEASDWML